eukprot:10103235-Heterocapsa_arctica.AAC.1
MPQTGQGFSHVWGSRWRKRRYVGLIHSHAAHTMLRTHGCPTRTGVCKHGSEDGFWWGGAESHQPRHIMSSS